MAEAIVILGNVENPRALMFVKWVWGNRSRTVSVNCSSGYGQMSLQSFAWNYTHGAC